MKKITYNFRFVAVGEVEFTGSTKFLSKFVQPFICNPFAPINNRTTRMSRSVVCEDNDKFKMMFSVSLTDSNSPHLPDGRMLYQKAAAPFSVINLAFK